MTLRRIDSFATDNPEKLADQLTRLEDNVTAEFARFPPKLSWSDWFSTGRPSLRYDVVTRINTDLAAVSATLPSISNANISRVVGILLQGANSIVIAPVESAALVDGAATMTLASTGLYLYTHDGGNWYRV